MGKFVVVGLIIATILLACSQPSNDVAEGGEMPGSVLREAIGTPSTITAELQAFANYNNRLDDAIADCMRINGFEYYPENSASESGSDDWGFHLPPGEYAQRYGFGIVNGAILGLSSVSDEANAYLRGLSNEELQAYQLALDGSASTEFADPADQDATGCRQQAFEAVEQLPWLAHQEWMAVMSVELFQRLSSDARIIEANQQWSACMASHGHVGLTTEEELSDSIDQEFLKLLGDLTPSASFGGETSWIDGLGVEARERLENFREREIELAVSSHECSKEHDPLVLSISKEIEHQLLAEFPVR